MTSIDPRAGVGTAVSSMALKLGQQGPSAKLLAAQAQVIMRFLTAFLSLPFQKSLIVPSKKILHFLSTVAPTDA